jgi:integrase/recombinase XerD
MSTRKQSLQMLVQDFFVQHLTIERNASGNTVASYRDAIKLFLQYAAEMKGGSPDQLDHKVLAVECVRGFLEWLQRKRQCSPRTRNHRLAALKAFARYVATVAPEHLDRCRIIREIRPARVEHKEVQYLTEGEVVQLIADLDVSAASGRRDHALLLLLYNTGARVQEIVDLNVGDIHDDGIPFVRLLGKGRKQRSCPLWSRTMTALRRMLADRRNVDASQPLFLGTRGQRLTRSGITYLLRRCQCNSGVLPRHAKRLSPHVIRHTTAMHLLQSGVDITTIAAWLGHSQLATTQGYVEIELRTKQAAIANQAALPELCEGEYPSSELIGWLDRIGRRCSYAECMKVEPPP